MVFQAIISTIASIVSIVGGVLGIITAVSKEPVFTRLWQRQLRTMSQPVLQPLPSLPTYASLGIVYGLISGVLAMLILLGVQALYLQTPAFGALGYIGLAVLSVASGVLPSRASGSLLSAVIAGGILGLFSFLTATIYALLNPSIVSASTAVWLAFLVVFGGFPFIVSILFGRLGRRLNSRVTGAPSTSPQK